MNSELNTNTNVPLPRFDLREAAFRRYEKIIAKACKGPMTDVPPFERQSAYTFISRFRDAVRGFKKFGYVSTMIPPNHPLEFRLVEMQNGRVSILPMSQLGVTEQKLNEEYDEEYVFNTLIPALDTEILNGVFVYKGLTTEQKERLKEKCDRMKNVFYEDKGEFVEIN